MNTAVMRLIQARTAAGILQASCPPNRPGDLAAIQIILEFFDSHWASKLLSELPVSQPEPEPEKPAKRLRLPHVPREARPPAARRRAPAEEEAPEETAEDQEAAAETAAKAAQLVDDWKAMKKAIGKITTIPEAIKAVAAAGITKTRLATVLGLDPAAVSRAVEGKIYPYIERAFKQRFQIPPVEGGEDISDAEARLKAIHEG